MRKNLKATCRTEACPQNGITHEFQSDVLYTVCGVCGQEVTDLVVEELPDAGAIEAE
jgi:hypothetical protein